MFRIRGRWAWTAKATSLWLITMTAAVQIFDRAGEFVSDFPSVRWQEVYVTGWPSIGMERSTWRAHRKIHVYDPAGELLGEIGDDATRTEASRSAAMASFTQQATMRRSSGSMMTAPLTWKFLRPSPP
jgi:hypothetical protein